jgi:hypothetical protein
MTYRPRRCLTAWLGLVAMCLVVLAPTISHVLRASRVIAVPVCTVDGGELAHRLVMAAVPMMTVAMHGSDSMGGMSGAHHSDSSPMDDCGYCDLLHHAPSMPGVPPAQPALILLLFAVLMLPALARFTPFGAFPSGQPRAPPRVS